LNRAASTQSLAVNLVAGYNANRMSALFDELERQARLLTPQEKAALARILIEELDHSGDTQVEQIWIAESQRRYQAYLKGEIKSLPGDEVMSQARNRLK
jgi:putative addiction module component (TIGR02574 family)